MRALIVLLLASGCGVDLGECDPALARVVVYDEGGIPAYEGQAQVQVSCGNGAFCHSSGATGESRRGSPAGLDFDVAIATVGSAPAEMSVARLGRDRDRIVDHAHDAYGQVESGLMPPFGEATRGVFEGVPRYVREDGTRLPPIDSVEGIARYRNWLACDAPVVERTEGTASVGEVVPRR